MKKSTSSRALRIVRLHQQGLSLEEIGVSMRRSRQRMHQLYQEGLSLLEKLAEVEKEK